LFRKKFIFLVFPQGTNKIKRFTIPKFVLLLGALFIFGLVAFSLVINQQYLNQKVQLAELDRLRQKTVKQNVQIYAFADKVRVLQQEMIKLTQNTKKLRAMTEENQELKRATTLALGGSDSAMASLESNRRVNQETLVRQLHLDLDGLLAQASFLEQNQYELDKYFEDTRSLLSSTPSLMPCKGWISSRFGYRLHPLSQQREFHRGIDISAQKGTPVIAPADGIVISKSKQPGYGLMVVINHGYGIITRYGHLNKTFVELGHRVKKGERFAEVGNTGRTTGPHLHYEIVRNRVPVNPIRYLAQR